MCFWGDSGNSGASADYGPIRGVPPPVDSKLREGVPPPVDSNFRGGGGGVNPPPPVSPNLHFGEGGVPPLLFIFPDRLYDGARIR